MTQPESEIGLKKPEGGGCGCHCLGYLVILLFLFAWTFWLGTQYLGLDASKIIMRRLTGGREIKTIFPDDLWQKKPTQRPAVQPPPSKSDLPALDVTPLKGIRVTAPAGALDQARVFTATELTERETENLHQSELQQGRAVLRAFRVNAGMGEHDRFHRPVQIAFNLAELGFPAGCWDEIGLAHRDDHGRSVVLRTRLENGVLSTQVRHNGVLHLVAMLGVVTSVFVHKDLDGLPEGSLTGKFIHVNWPPGKNIFQLRYPADWEPANPAAVQECSDRQLAVYNRHFSPGPTSFPAIQYTLRFIAYQNDPELLELKRMIQDETWLLNNFLPKKAGLAAIAMTRAAEYLEARKFRKPGYGGLEWMTEIYLSPTSLGSDTMGLAHNPRLTRGFVVLDGTKIPNLTLSELNPQNRTNFDKLQTTGVHEYFHSCQLAYVTIDSKSYLWFFEATAAALEYEAEKWFKDKGFAESWDPTDRDGAAHFDPLDLQTGEDREVQQHGYGCADFLEYLRGRHFQSNPDDFLPRLLEDFAGWRSSPLLSVQSSTGLDEAGLDKEFETYADGLYPKILMIGKGREGISTRDLELGPGQFRVLYPLGGPFPLSARGLAAYVMGKRFQGGALTGAKLVVRDSSGRDNPGLRVEFSPEGKTWRTLQADSPLVVALPSDAATKGTIPVFIKRVTRARKDIKNRGVTEILLLVRPEKPRLETKGEKLTTFLSRSPLASLARGDGLPPCLEGFELLVQPVGGGKQLVYPLPPEHSAEGWSEKVETIFSTLGRDPAKPLSVKIFYREVVDRQKKIVGPDSAAATIELNLAPAAPARKTVHSVTFLGRGGPAAFLLRNGTRVSGTYRSYGNLYGDPGNWGSQVTIESGSFDESTGLIRGKALLTERSHGKMNPVPDSKTLMEFEFAPGRSDGQSEGKGRFKKGNGPWRNCKLLVVTESAEKYFRDMIRIKQEQSARKAGLWFEFSE